MLDRYQAIDAEKLTLAPGAKVLDVGCGRGRHLLELTRNDAILAGVDMDREELRAMRFMLDLTKKEGPVNAAVHMIEGDGSRLPFEDGLFECVICTETLEHVPDDAAIMRELVRVLRPGGVLVISVPDEYSERLLWRVSPRYRNHPGGHVRIYRRQQIKQLLQEHGTLTFAVDYRHSLESVRWMVHSVVDSEWGKPGRLTRAIRWLLDTPSHRNWRSLAWSDAIGNLVLPKSIVVYGRKPLESAP